MSGGDRAFVGALVLFVVAGTIGGVVLLAWLGGSDLTEFSRSHP